MTPLKTRLPGRVTAVYHSLLEASADRIVAPHTQPFAFRTDTGRVRDHNEDMVAMMGARRRSGEEAWAGIVCDGMGGMAHGAEAAALTVASMIGVLSSTEEMAPAQRLARAIEVANQVVFGEFGGHSGAVVVALLLDGPEPLLGWVGDARAYGLSEKKTAHKLTRDDTAAEHLPSPEPDGDMLESDTSDTLLRAIGLQPQVKPNILPVPESYQQVLLMSDGAHLLEPPALDWLCRYAPSSGRRVDRLVEGALLQGGPDNATVLEVDLSRGLQPFLLPFDTSEGLAVWIGTSPHVWEVVRKEPSRPRDERGQEPSRPRNEREQEPRHGGPSKQDQRFRPNDPRKPR